jgi:hypothetical protein
MVPREEGADEWIRPLTFRRTGTRRPCPKTIRSQILPQDSFRPYLSFDTLFASVARCALSLRGELIS